MLLDRNDLKTLTETLEAAHRTAMEGTAIYCKTANLTEDGKNEREETNRKGTKIKVSLGLHGRAFLAIDPTTKKVSCAKCAK